MRIFGAFWMLFAFVHLASAKSNSKVAHVVLSGKIHPTQFSKDRHMYIQGKVIIVEDLTVGTSSLSVQFRNALPKTAYEVKLHKDDCANSESVAYLDRKTHVPVGLSLLTQTSPKGLAYGRTTVNFIPSREARSIVLFTPQGTRAACASITRVMSPAKINEFVSFIVKTKDSPGPLVSRTNTSAIVHPTVGPSPRTPRHP